METISLDGTINTYIEERKTLNKIEAAYQDQKSKIREKLAEYITDTYKFLFNTKPVEKNLLTNYVLSKNPSLILEEGAGNDDIYRKILNPNIQKYIRCDVSENQLNRISDNRVENMRYNGLYHNLEDNSIDVSFSKCVLHHIDNGCDEGRERNRVDYLKEQKRIIKSGGKSITMDVSDPTKGNLKGKFWHYFKHRFILGEEEHYFLTKDRTIKLYEKAGYVNITGEELNTYKGKYFVVSGEKP